MDSVVDAFMPKSELLCHSQHLRRASLERHRPENWHSATKISPRRVGNRMLASVLFERNLATGNRTALDASCSPLRTPRIRDRE